MYLERSYVGLNANDIDTAVVDLCGILVEQIPALHERFALKRTLAMDLSAADLVRNRQVA